jgi:hypothetical protein
MLGMVGSDDILENPGVAGDLREDCDDIDAASTMLAEFFRDPSEVIEPDLSLRENKPILAIGRLREKVGLKGQDRSK